MGEFVPKVPEPMTAMRSVLGHREGYAAALRELGVPEQADAAVSVFEMLKGLTPVERERTLKELRLKLQKDRAEINAKMAPLQAQEDAFTDILEWAERTEDNQTVERVDHSIFHKLIDAASQGQIISSKKEQHGVADVVPLFLTAQIVIVEHAWDKLFKHATVEGGDGGKAEIRLPHDVCAFEAQISGKRVIMISQDANDYPHLFFQAGEYWLYSAANESMFPRLHDLIKATCIVIDSEIAEVEAIRAPIDLNKQRLKNARTPLRDYHVVHLGRRYRTVGTPSTDHSGSHRRLHFRRGHWRRYAAFKSWVRWTLVGNPDLGFVDKEYRA